MEPILTIEPPSGPISLTASCVVSSRPVTFRLNCLWMCSGVMASSGGTHRILHCSQGYRVSRTPSWFPKRGGGCLSVEKHLLDSNRLPSFFSNSSDDRIRARLAACIVHYNRSAFSRKMLRDRSSDTLRSSCDYFNFS